MDIVVEGFQVFVKVVAPMLAFYFVIRIIKNLLA